MKKIIEEIIENSTVEPPSDLISIFNNNNLIFEITDEKVIKEDNSNHIDWYLKGEIRHNEQKYSIYIEGSSEAIVTYSEWTDTQHYNIETYIVEEII